MQMRMTPTFCRFSPRSVARARAAGRRAAIELPVADAAVRVEIAEPRRLKIEHALRREERGARSMPRLTEIQTTARERIRVCRLLFVLSSDVWPPQGDFNILLCFYSSSSFSSLCISRKS